MHDSFAMCPNLNEVHFLSEIPVSLGSGAFDWHTIIYVPDGCFKAYFEEYGYEYNWADNIWDYIEFTSLHMFGKACDAGENIEQTTPFQYQDGLWVWEGDLTAMDDFKILLQRESGLIWPCLIPNAKGTQVFYAEENSEIHSQYNPYKVDKDGYYRVVINTDNGAMHISYLGSMKSPVRELYLLGDAVDSGWSLADMPAFENNNGVFTWTGHLKANSRWRFPLQKVKYGWWPCLVLSADGTTLSLGQGDADDTSYLLPQSGIYTLTFNLTDWDNRTFTIELVEADPEVEASYTVVGTISGDEWNNAGEAGLMTKEGDYYVAKNLDFKWRSTCYEDCPNQNWFEFKVVETGTWTGYGASGEHVANTAIDVTYGGFNINVASQEGVYDVYYDKANSKVWVMTPGYSPNDEVPLLSYVSELYMLGGACDTSWELSMMLPFTHENGLWTWEGNLSSGEHFRFPTQKVLHAWWPCLIPNLDGTAVDYGTSDSDYVYDETYSPSESGYYKIIVDCSDGSMSINRLGDKRKRDFIRELYLLGPAVPDVGWNLENVKSNSFLNNNGIFTWEGSLISGELAITPQTFYLTPRLCFLEDGKLAYDQTPLTDITIDQDGTYKIVVDARDCDNITYELIKNE